MDTALDMLIVCYKVSNTNENEKGYDNDMLDLPSLESVTFGERTFINCHHIVFEGM